MPTEYDGLRCEDHQRRVESLETHMQSLLEVVYGKNGRLGVLARLEIVWRSYVWLVGLIGVMIGSAITLIVSRVVG